MAHCPFTDQCKLYSEWSENPIDVDKNKCDYCELSEALNDLMKAVKKYLDTIT